MSCNMYGRDADVEEIKKMAESNFVGNEAFLGVKGVGKTTLFQAYFTAEKRKELAQKYKKLFVFSQLDSRKQGSDLYQFLMDIVKRGIMEIPDEAAKKEIMLKIKEGNEFFDSPDMRLEVCLDAIKESGYDLIIIMDHFHCMARDTEIGSEQYDVLRSLNEARKVIYWIITDTDLVETRASKQYIVSFLAQKFTSKTTIVPVKEGCRDEMLTYFMEQKKVELQEEEKEVVLQVSGGIPAFMGMLMDVVETMKREGQSLSAEALLNRVLLHDGCSSLFHGWISGLNEEQKKILYDVAQSEDGIKKEEVDTQVSSMMEGLADQIGRGLLHGIVSGTVVNKWDINILAFKKYILSKKELFVPKEEISLPNGTGINDYVAAMSRDIITSDMPKSEVTIHVHGDYIQNQTNHVINVGAAVAGLEELQKLMYANPIYLDEAQARKSLQYLPFKQKEWLEMDEVQQEEELDKYADGIFSSQFFNGEDLTIEQKQRFCLTDKLLGDLSDSCRKQIICGIRVYGLIESCIQRFGLSMGESESPRGILFARAFERHLKDVAAPAYRRVPEMAEQKVYPTTIAFKDYPLDKTTIGTYSAILNFGHPILAQASAALLDRGDRNAEWWQELVSRLRVIGALRNDCCHSGTAFNHEKLTKLITMIFNQNSLEDILMLAQIPALERGQFTRRAVACEEPILSLLGCQANFQILKKGNNGNLKGLVNGKYEASLPQRYASGMDYVRVKNTTITVTIERIQNNMYILKL